MAISREDAQILKEMMETVAEYTVVSAANPNDGQRARYLHNEYESDMESFIDSLVGDC